MAKKNPSQKGKGASSRSKANHKSTPKPKPRAKASAPKARSGMNPRTQNIVLHAGLIVGFLALLFVYFNPVTKGEVLQMSDIQQYSNMSIEVREYREATGEAAFLPTTGSDTFSRLTSKYFRVLFPIFSSTFWVSSCYSGPSKSMYGMPSWAVWRFPFRRISLSSWGQVTPLRPKQSPI